MNPDDYTNDLLKDLDAIANAPDVFGGDVPDDQGFEEKDMDSVDAPSDEAVAQAFQVQAQVFDLDLPWTADGGRILNRFGVRVGQFENWETADAIVAMMNGSAQLMEAAAALQAAAPPVDSQGMLRYDTAFDDKTDALSFMGIPIKLDPALDDGQLITVTRAQLEEIARQQAMPGMMGTRPQRMRFS